MSQSPGLQTQASEQEPEPTVLEDLGPQPEDPEEPDEHEYIQKCLSEARRQLSDDWKLSAEKRKEGNSERLFTAGERMVSGGVAERVYAKAFRYIAWAEKNINCRYPEIVTVSRAIAFIEDFRQEQALRAEPITYETVAKIPRALFELYLRQRKAIVTPYPRLTEPGAVIYDEWPSTIYTKDMTKYLQRVKENVKSKHRIDMSRRTPSPEPNSPTLKSESITSTADTTNSQRSSSKESALVASGARNTENSAALMLEMPESDGEADDDTPSQTNNTTHKDSKNDTPGFTAINATSDSSDMPRAATNDPKAIRRLEAKLDNLRSEMNTNNARIQGLLSDGFKSLTTIMTMMAEDMKKSTQIPLLQAQKDFDEAALRLREIRNSMSSSTGLETELRTFSTTLSRNSSNMDQVRHGNGTNHIPRPSDP